MQACAASAAQAKNLQIRQNMLGRHCAARRSLGRVDTDLRHCGAVAHRRLARFAQNAGQFLVSDSQDLVEILDFPHPKPVRHLYGELSHKEGGALSAHYGSESSPSLILGMLAIEMARRGRGHVDIDLRDGGVFQQSLTESPLQGLSATGKSMRFFYLIPDRQCRRGNEGGKPKGERESYSSGQAIQPTFMNGFSFIFAGFHWECWECWECIVAKGRLIGAKIGEYAPVSGKPCKRAALLMLDCALE